MEIGDENPLFTVDSTIFRRQDPVNDGSGETLLVLGTARCEELGLSLETSDTPVAHGSIEELGTADEIARDFALCSAKKFVELRCNNCDSKPTCSSGSNYVFGVTALSPDLRTLPNDHFDDQVR